MDIESLIFETGISDSAKVTYLALLHLIQKGNVTPAMLQDERNIGRSTYFEHLHELRKVKLIEPGTLAPTTKESRKAESSSLIIYSKSNKIERGIVQNSGLSALDKKANATAKTFGKSSDREPIPSKLMKQAWILATAEKVEKNAMPVLSLLGKWISLYEKHEGTKYEKGKEETGPVMYRRMKKLVELHGPGKVVDGLDAFFTNKNLAWIDKRLFSFCALFSRYVLPELRKNGVQKKVNKHGNVGYGRYVPGRDK